MGAPPAATHGDGRRRDAGADRGQVGAVGLLTSLVVDNQVVDVDLDERTMLYHCVEVPRDDPYDAVNGPVERRLLAIADRA